MNVMDLLKVEDAVVVITGASSGLGVSFARGFAQAGADVVLAARRADKLDSTVQTVRESGHTAHGVVTDVADPAQCQRLIDTAMEIHGRVDVLINNAGVGTACPATKERPEQFSSVVDVNLSGAYWVAQACGRVMQPGSSIINISSVLGLTTLGLPQAAYSASKAGLLGLTRDLAQQWGSRKGIRVNAIAPGFFESEMTAAYTPDYIAEQMRRTLLGRMGDPSELVATAIWLASRAAGYVTGQTVVVDGGITIA